MRLKLSLLAFLIILAALADTKRSSGRSRGSSSRSSSFWTRKSKSSSEPQKPVAPKPSAPKEPEIQKQTANVQHSAPVNKPIGWNVDNVGPNKKIGQSNIEQKQNVNPSYSSGPGGYPNNPGGYPQGGLYPNNPGGNPQGGLYSNNPGGYPHGGQYSHNPSGYPNGGGYPNAGGYSNPGGYHNPGAYPNPGGYSNAGGYPHNPGYNNPSGQYPNNMGGGYPNNMGGYPQQTGLMGSFGGNRNGYGGYGGNGGYGGYGGYGMKKSGGFFGKHAFRNVLGGLFVWYLVSGLVSKPYKVYNYYNQPKEQLAAITLPANVLTLCNENATNICVPGSTAICTQDSKILCVVTMTATSPCQNNTAEMCVNTTIPCIDDKDPLCQNRTNVDNSTMVSVPCLTNMTLNTGQSSLAPNITLPASEDNKFCVTTMAIPDPDLPAEDVKNVENGKNVEDSKNATEATTDDNTGWNPSNLTAIGYYGRYGSGY